MQTNPNKPSKGGLFHRLRQCFSSTSTGKPSANQTIEKKDTQKGSIPEKYICSITGKIMAEPYTDLDGNNYDRVAIEKWLQTRSCSPVTLKPLRKEDLFPNLKLKESIDADRSTLASTLIGEESFNFDTITYTEQDVNMDPISLRLSCHEINEEERLVKVSVLPPDSKAPVPVSICAVVDISGSMGTEATIRGESGDKETYGLSVLDVVKHALKTVVVSLREVDKMALVTFSDSAEVKFQLMHMTEGNKKKALRVIENLICNGYTNLYAGIQQGLELIRTYADADRNKSIWVFTDGLPNQHPARGEVKTLKRYFESHRFRCQLNTFGFGYQLDSNLLAALADETQGTYSFIPDSSMVGTIFVNALANQFTIIAQNVSIQVEAKRGVKILPSSSKSLYGKDRLKKDSNHSIDIGPVHFGQTRDFLIKISKPIPENPGSLVEVKVKFSDTRRLAAPENSAEVELTSSVLESEGIYVPDLLRLHVVNTITQILSSPEPNAEGRKSYLENLLAEFGKNTLPDNTYLADLLKDVEGQCTTAVSRDDWFKRWGRHYLHSLCRAHFLQICNNFKDPGVQHYGGDLFHRLQLVVEEIFDRLPPPKPTGIRRPPNLGFGGGGNQAAVPKTRMMSSMKAFNKSSNPCIDGECEIMLASGLTKKASKIRNGDQVKTNGEDATVLCVVKTNCTANPAEMIRFSGGLCITPYHPIRQNREWVFPIHVKTDGRKDFSSSIYSFVLDREHIVVANGIECVCLGHTWINESVVGHKYFGIAIVEDLKLCKGWRRGFIEMRSNWLLRDPRTTCVCGMDRSREIVSASE
ncbi:hint-domain-containing protein [Paraphysoderma sedebokerense]|nr:hint-domain-containing protein [Paraphysoderma sedebokerense]